MDAPAGAERGVIGREAHWGYRRIAPFSHTENQPLYSWHAKKSAYFGSRDFSLGPRHKHEPRKPISIYIRKYLNHQTEEEEDCVGNEWRWGRRILFLFPTYNSEAAWRIGKSRLDRHAIENILTALPMKKQVVTNEFQTGDDQFHSKRQWCYRTHLS